MYLYALDLVVSDLPSLDQLLLDLMSLDLSSVYRIIRASLCCIMYNCNFLCMIILPNCAMSFCYSDSLAVPGGISKYE
jgi:hypothetical protein